MASLLKTFSEARCRNMMMTVTPEVPLLLLNCMLWKYNSEEGVKSVLLSGLCPKSVWVVLFRTSRVLDIWAFRTFVVFRRSWHSGCRRLGPIFGPQLPQTLKVQFCSWPNQPTVRLGPIIFYPSPSSINYSFLYKWYFILQDIFLLLKSAFLCWCRLNVCDSSKSNNISRSWVFFIVLCCALFGFWRQLSLFTATLLIFWC